MIAVGGGGDAGSADFGQAGDITLAQKGDELFPLGGGLG